MVQPCRIAQRYLLLCNEGLFITFLVLFPHFVPLPFYSYAVFCLAVIIIYLRKQRKTFGDLGLERNGLTTHTFITGILSALFWIAVYKWVYHPFITHSFIIAPYAEYDFIRLNARV